MHRTVENWRNFCELWHGPTNFRLAGEVGAWEWQPPPLDQIVDELRLDDAVTIKRGARSGRLDLEVLSPDTFRAIPIERAMEVPFALAHFDLGRFDAPGRFLHGFGDTVLGPWEAALAGRRLYLGSLLSDRLRQRPRMCHELPHGRLARARVAGLRDQAILRAAGP